LTDSSTPDRSSSIDRLMATTAAPTPSGTPATPAALGVPAPRPASVPSSRQPYSVVGRSRNEGHGKRLTAAFEALEVFPALAESRDRLLALVTEEHPSTGDVVRAIESDVALVIAVLRLANSLESPKRGQIE